MIQPSPEGLLNTAKGFGVGVAGARFELWTRPTWVFSFLLTY
jgi:hypothetical protein